MINLQMHYADSKNTFNVFPLLTPRRVKKRAEQCLPWFFGADAILAHAKDWDLVL